MTRFSFSSPMKYTVSHTIANATTPLYQIGPHAVCAESSIVGLNLYSPLSLLQIEWGNCILEWERSLAEMSKACGWRGALNFAGAKSLPRKVISEDSARTVLIQCEHYGYFQLSWLSDQLCQGVFHFVPSTDSLEGTCQFGCMLTRDHHYYPRTLISPLTPDVLCSFYRCTPAVPN